MITPTDISTILYRKCAEFGIDRYKKGNIPMGDVTSDRVVIIMTPQENDSIWKKGFVHVNLEVPDIDSDGRANLTRLNELERMSATVLDDVVGEFDGTPYYYWIDSIGIEEDSKVKCHYINVRVFFQVLNTK